MSLSVDPQTAALLVGYHCRMVFLHTMHQLAAVGLLWIGRSTSQRLHQGAHVGQREALDSALTSCSLMSAKGLEWGLRRLLAPGMEGQLRGSSLNALSFMAEKCNTSSSSSASSSVSWLERLSGTEGLLNASKNRKKGKNRRGKADLGDTAVIGVVSGIDRDLLLLLDPSAEGLWHPKNFNADPDPAEVMLAAEPLRKLFDRATEVLQLYPGNELLVQVCKVAARISELHTSTPVGKLLMTVQLLLVKAQEWEQFAAKHVSLQLEMAGLSVLIGRWRELELRSWSQLLRCKEQGYVQTAMMYWFTLARSLNSEPDLKTPTAAINIDDLTAKNKQLEIERKRKDVWPGLAELTPQWLWVGSSSTPTFTSDDTQNTSISLFDHDEYIASPPSALSTQSLLPTTAAAGAGVVVVTTDQNTGSIYDDADGTAAHSRVLAKKFKMTVVKAEMDERGYLNSIFEILNYFLQRSVVGEFPTRVHLVRLFALQLHQDAMEASDTDTGSNSSRSHSSSSSSSTIADTISNDETTTQMNADGNKISLKKQLARVVMGVWRYYQQFLPAVRAFQDMLRGPIERRLKGEVKIGKWDQLSTYGLIEHSERVHKKLNKVRGDVVWCGGVGWI